MSSLLACHRIVTTEAKAKALRRIMERFITRAKHDTWRSNQKLASFFAGQPNVLALLKKAAERYRERTGGYTRLWKLGYRRGDRAPLSMIEFVDAPFDMKKAFGMLRGKTESSVLKGLIVEPSGSATPPPLPLSDAQGSLKHTGNDQRQSQTPLDAMAEPQSRATFSPASFNPRRFDWLRSGLSARLDQDIVARRSKGPAAPSLCYLSSLLFKSDKIK